MKKKGSVIQAFLSNPDPWYYIGLLCWLTIAYLQQEEQTGLGRYGAIGGPFAGFLTPVIVFAFYRPAIRQKRSVVQYWIYWAICLVVYPFAVAMIANGLYPQSSMPAFMVTGAIIILSLEGLLIIHTWYKNKVRNWAWIQKIDLEKAVLISITLIALGWAIMGASSWGDPEYHNSERLLLGFECRPAKILANPVRFLSMLVQFMVMNLCGYFYFIANNRVLVPILLKQKGIIYYSLGVLALIGITYPLLGQLLARLPLNHILGGIFPQDPFKLESAFAALAIILISLPVVLATQWAQQNNRIVSLEKEKTQTELDLLKQQLNPHFFFNTLNNLYALSLQKSDQTPESIMQLSHLTRYVIYKAKSDTVNVQDEISYLEDYIQLQQIRMKKTLQLEFIKDIAIDAPPVAPLLLIVLVENAFKHGIEPAENNAFLHLRLEVDQHHLFFTCTNSVEEPANKTPGIGLANLRRRLELLYPDKYVLETGLENHTFIAKLQVDLS